MQPQTERLLQKHLRSRRWARRPYRAALWFSLLFLAPIFFGMLAGIVALLFRSVGLH